MNALALPSTVADIVDEYDRKVAYAEQAIKDVESAHTAFNMAATIQGTYAEQVIESPRVSLSRLRDNLLKSGWRTVYNRLQIERLATAKDKALFNQSMANPPPLTYENAKATFGDYFMNTRFHILRGVAEVFSSLDPAYKSHSKVKIGVAGLPKRVILSNWGSYNSGWGRDKFRDIVNALAAYRGQPLFEYEEMSAINTAHDAGEDAILDGRTYTRQDRTRSYEYKTPDRGLMVRKFSNGNAHVIFDKNACRDINMALAEFYGDVLPDVEEENTTRQASTEVSKDLQFYWSPPAVITAALDFAEIYDAKEYARGDASVRNVLEPSCGDGRIMDELRSRGCNVIGVEYDAGRARQTVAKGHKVINVNFLETIPTPIYDFVVMNPPFYGRHYVKHVRHALKFLRPGGTLVSILPATARYDHKELDGEWRDLPVGSFSEVGTNVPTVLLKIRTKANG